MRRIIQSLPNISEGRRTEVLEACAEVLAGVPGLRLLDTQTDPDHNRSAFTLVGDEEALRRGVLALCSVAFSRIDLRNHRGEHPRIGALDVVPFIPLEGVTMEDCVRLARTVGQEIAQAFSIPVFLYEEAASAPHRSGLEDVRRGEFEGLQEKLKDPAWRPDHGPAVPHASAGATAVGARMPLIAYNIDLGTTDLHVARSVAAAIRHTSGGYRYVRAAALIDDERGVAQVSINLTDYTKTPLFRVFDTVRSEAERHGVGIVGSELVGFVPAQALIDVAEHHLRLVDFAASQVLERRIREAE
jgi:glutamate formiminotransferase / 5-formyltetrahydrofolate cyclo-ligase